MAIQSFIILIISYYLNALLDMIKNTKSTLEYKVNRGEIPEITDAEKIDIAIGNELKELNLTVKKKT